MATPERAGRATVDDLYGIDGKAELIDGEIVLMGPTGDHPSHASLQIVFSLNDHARRTGFGRAVGDNAGFVVNLPRRRSLSPDAAFWTGPSSGMKFFDGAPIFAAEVRGEGDYGAAAEREIVAKRDDYFAAGTRVVWDVDLLSDSAIVRAYSIEESDASTPVRARRARPGPMTPSPTGPCRSTSCFSTVAGDPPALSSRSRTRDELDGARTRCPRPPPTPRPKHRPSPCPPSRPSRRPRSRTRT